VKKHAAFSTAPVYYYYFEFDGELGVAKRAVKVTKPGNFDPANLSLHLML
jgi:hypothetical protein